MLQTVLFLKLFLAFDVLILELFGMEHCFLVVLLARLKHRPSWPAFTVS
jgi:hypothetical protein